MRIFENDERRLEKIKLIKKNCLLCAARAGLSPERETEKKAVLSGLEELKSEYDDLYNEYRKENAEAEKIQTALENKRVCMDALEICGKCERDFERVNRFLSGTRL